MWTLWVGWEYKKVINMKDGKSVLVDDGAGGWQTLATPADSCHAVLYCTAMYCPVLHCTLSGVRTAPMGAYQPLLSPRTQSVLLSPFLSSIRLRIAGPRYSREDTLSSACVQLAHSQARDGTIALWTRRYHSNSHQNYCRAHAIVELMQGRKSKVVRRCRYRLVFRPRESS